MKTIIRATAIYTFALYMLPQWIPGLRISGDLFLFLAGFGLALMFLVLKPVLNIISFPVNAVTLGLFSIFTNAFILYLFTILVPDVSISPFSYPRTDLFGVIIPVITFNTFFAYLYTAFVLAVIDSFISWLMRN